MKKILIIDSAEEIRNTFSAALLGAGYHVVVADAREALFKVTNEPFEFIIVDLCAPKIISIELIQALYAISKSKKTRIVISSPTVSKEVFEKFQNQYFVHMLPKPIPLKKLVHQINELDNPTTNEAIKPKQSSGFDVRIINPLISGALEAIATVFAPLTVGKPYLRKEKEVSGDISGLIGLISEGFKGNVALSFSTASYLKLISNKFGQDIKELNEESRDAMSEVIKLVIDQAQIQFEKQSLNVSMNTPTIVAGNGHSLNHQSKSAPVVILFQNSHNEGFRMEICTLS